jgi:hypothetical protein
MLEREYSHHRELYIDAVRVIVQLNLVSHASGANLDPSARSTETSRTGNRPPGGLDWRDDRQPEYRQKSAEHFRWRLSRCRTSDDVRMVLADATDALEAWRKTPLGAVDPQPGDPLFKRWIIKQDKTDSELARLTGVSRQYINRIRNAER